MIYLTYTEYKEMGGSIDESAFNRIIYRASGIIASATFGRVDGMLKVPDEVKHLCRDLVEYFSENLGNSKQVSSRSQSAGGVSESESFVIRSIEERAGEIDDMVKDYLMNVSDDMGTPLLYRGAQSVSGYKTIYDKLPKGYEFLMVKSND